MKEPYLIHHYLGRSAESHPDREAVVMGKHHLTYAQLSDRSSKLAGLLQRLGVHRGDRVGICMSKSIEAVVAIYAICLLYTSPSPRD